MTKPSAAALRAAKEINSKIWGMADAPSSECIAKIATIISTELDEDVVRQKHRTKFFGEGVVFAVHHVQRVLCGKDAVDPDGQTYTCWAKLNTLLDQLRQTELRGKKARKG